MSVWLVRLSATGVDLLNAVNPHTFVIARPGSSKSEYRSSAPIKDIPCVAYSNRNNDTPKSARAMIQYGYMIDPEKSSAIVIEPETDNDVESIRAVVQAAFGAHRTVGTLVDLIRESPNFIPELSLVAKDGDEIIGHVMVSHAELVDDDAVRHRVLTLSPLAVSPLRQNEGIGGSLIRAAIGAADQLGEPLITLEGSPEYYPRFGFRPAANYGVTINLPEWAPLEAAMVYPLSNYDPSFTGVLEYPPAFAATGSGQ